MTTTAASSSVKPMPTAGIGQKTVRGFGWMMAQTVWVRLLTFGSSTILAWLLSQHDFAKIGLTNTIAAFTALLVSPGIDDVLVQRHQHSRRWLTPAFWMSMTCGISGALLMLIFAPLAARMYREPQVAKLLLILAPGAAISALTLVPTAVLRANMRFKLLSAIGMIEVVFAQLMTVGLAWLGAGVYSFVIPTTSVAVLHALIMWSIVHPPVRWKLELRRWRYLLGDSSALFINRVLITAVAQGDYMTLGALWHDPNLGAYYFAFNLAMLAVRTLAGNLLSVLFPALSLLRDHPQRQVEAAVTAASVMAMVVVPLCFLQAALARPGMTILFGTKWVNAIPMVQILSIGLAFDAASWITGALLQAQGRFLAMLRLSCVCAPIFFILIIFAGYERGAIGVALAVCLYYVIVGPPALYISLRPAGVPFGNVIALYSKPVITSVAAVGPAWLVSQLFPSTMVGRLLQIALTTAIAVVIYWPLSQMLMPQPWAEMRMRFRAKAPDSPPIRSATI